MTTTDNSTENSTKDSLKSVLENIRNAAQDIVTLDVVTMTGEININASEHMTKDRFDVGKLVDTLMAGAPVEQKLTVKVLALTHLEMDQDCIQFVRQDLTDSEKPLVEAHNAMVKTATEARNSLLLTIKEIVGLSN